MSSISTKKRVYVSSIELWEELSEPANWYFWVSNHDVTGEILQGGALAVGGDIDLQFDVVTCQPGSRLVLRSSLFFGASVTTWTLETQDVTDGVCEVCLTATHGGWMAPLFGGEGILLDVEHFVNLLASDTEEAHAVAEPLLASNPKLEERWMILEMFEPNLYYRWDEAGVVDEGGGGLNAYGLTLCVRFDGTYVPEKTVDDGGYDNWGSGEHPTLKFEPKPAGLDGALFLPSVLYATPRGAVDTSGEATMDDERLGPQLLVHEALMEGLVGTPVPVRDVFGEERSGYCLVQPKEMSVADACESSESLVSVPFPGLTRHTLVSGALAERWASLDPLCQTSSVRRWNDSAMPSCYATLEEWQSGRPTVTIVPPSE